MVEQLPYALHVSVKKDDRDSVGNPEESALSAYSKRRLQD